MSKKAANVKSSMNSMEMKEFVSHIITNNQFIQNQGKIPAAVEISGASGIGKTSLMIQLAKDNKLAFVKLNLAQIEELGDLIGFPLKEFEVQKIEDGGKAVSKWVPEITLNNYIHNKYKPTGQKRMSHAVPQWIQGKESGGILLLDDWNRADPRFIQAVMELIDRQEYISWKLPKNWHIVLTSNPDDGTYMVNSLDPAQRTRFISVELAFDLNIWAKWAEENQIDGRCINFMLLNPELMDKDNNQEEGINARSVTTFFNAISSVQDFEANLPLIQKIGEGCVGPNFTTMFTTFINNRLDRLITPSEIVTGTDEKKVLDTMRKVIGMGNNYRADIASIITTRVINFSQYYAEKNPITTAILDRFEALIKAPDMLQNDLKYLLVKRLFTGNPKLSILLNRLEVQKYAVK